MAHFAEIDENNIVIRVIVVPDEEEHRGHEFLSQDLGLGGTWLKTSYNTIGGQHSLGGTAYRLNYAAPGHRYDEELDGFIPPKPYESWTEVDPQTGQHVAPIPCPEYDVVNDPFYWIWSEEDLMWIQIPKLL